MLATTTQKRGHTNCNGLHLSAPKAKEILQFIFSHTDVFYVFSGGIIIVFAIIVYKVNTFGNYGCSSGHHFSILRNDFFKVTFGIIMSTPLDNGMTPIIHIITDN